MFVKPWVANQRQIFIHLHSPWKAGWWYSCCLSSATLLNQKTKMLVQRAMEKATRSRVIRFCTAANMKTAS